MLGLLAAGCLAFVLSLVGAAWLIPFLRARGIGQPIHEAVAHHAKKAGTPTMGGVALCVVVPVASAVGVAAVDAGFGGALTLVVGIVAGGVVGALDDWLKVTRGRNTLGLRERQKTILLLAVAVLVVVTSDPSACHAPSLAGCEPLPDIGTGPWAIWVLVVVWLTTNAVNFTDGADGLLIGCSVPPLTLLAAIAYWQHRHPDLYPTTADALQLSIVLTALAAGCLGLLWWNAAPATLIIGDTGSLAIGSAIAIASIRLGVELLIPVFGAVYVAQGASSFLQRFWFKTTRRFRRDHQPQRLFRMAPLHHHFELLGWPETHVVLRFWIVSGCASALAGAIFYADAVRSL